ncbi:YitT family protein [Fretibacterium sp. OH1220_COT-178]|nr:YitT family protein [Fretibacterium sp. OH1220_COT-178]
MRVKNFLLSLPGLLRREWRAVLAVLTANVVFAFAVSYFTLPYRFPDLGISGLAVLSNYVFGISPSWIIFIGNVLLIFWGRRSLNLRFLVLTFSSIVIFSLFIPIFRDIPLNLPRDKFMATVITGLLKGVAIGMLFNIGGSSGGLDIVAMVLRRRHGIEVGRFFIFVNFFILALSVGVVGLEPVVYGAVGLYVFGITLDSVTRSFDKRKQAFIITNVPDEVCRFITAKGKGVTRLEGHGAYTGQPRPVLISLLEPRQVVQLKAFLKEKDPRAFVSICDATEVLGQGFKSWKSL